MKSKLVLLFLFIHINFLFAQHIHFHGVVWDNNTRTPLSGISIHTKDNKIGTFSSKSGKFSLYIPNVYENDYLYFSSIDYQTDSILINNNNENIKLFLLPKIYELKEVFVMLDSTLISLLRQAYNKIPENYPMLPTLCTGFHQESLFDEEGALYNLIEAEISVYKEKYDKIHEMAGQVELLRSRIKHLRKPPTALSRGVFLPIFNDIVLQRKTYINPDQFKNYHYTFQGIRSYSGEDCYEISFSTGRSQGTMLISTENLAYLSFDIHYENPHNQTRLRPSNPIEVRQKIRYERLDNIYYLKRMSSYNKFNDTIFSNVDYISTHIQTESVRPIPLDKRMEVMDVLAAKANNYDSNAWVDSNILANEKSQQLDFQFPPEEANTIFQQQTIPQSSFIDKLIAVFKIGYGICFIPEYDLFCRHAIFKYQPNLRWNVQLIESKDLFYKQKNYVAWRIMGEYRMNLNKSGFPLLLGTSLGISDVKCTDTGFNHHQFIVPQLSLSKRFSKFFTWELFYNYSIPFSTTNTDIKSYQQIGISFCLF